MEFFYLKATDRPPCINNRKQMKKIIVDNGPLETKNIYTFFHNKKCQHDLKIFLMYLYYIKGWVFLLLSNRYIHI